MDMNKEKMQFEFLYEKEGRYFYRYPSGKTFKSRKKLHEDEIEEVYEAIEKRADEVVRPTLAAKKSTSKTKTEDEDMARLVDSFTLAMGEDPNSRAPAAQVAEAFKIALTNLSDCEVSAEDIDVETQKLAMKLEQAGIIFQVAHNNTLQKKVLENSEKKLLGELEVGTQRQRQRLQDATYDANQDALENAGLRKGSPMWLIRLAKITSGFWGIVIVILSFFTVTPIVMLSKSLGVQIKNSPLKWILTMLLYFGLAFLVFAIIANATEMPLPSWLEWIR